MVLFKDMQRMIDHGKKFNAENYNFLPWRFCDALEKTLENTKLQLMAHHGSKLKMLVGGDLGGTGPNCNGIAKVTKHAVLRTPRAGRDKVSSSKESFVDRDYGDSACTPPSRTLSSVAHALSMEDTGASSDMDDICLSQPVAGHSMEI